MVNRKRKRRIALVALLAFVLGTTAFAYAASITFNGASDAGAAGQGSGDISGYDVTNIHYTLDDNDPSNLTGVTFELSPATATTVTATAGPGVPDRPSPWCACAQYAETSLPSSTFR